MRNIKELFLREKERQQIDSERLCLAVMLRINEARTKVSKVRMSIFGSLSIASLVATIFSLRYVAEEISISGFAKYMSLMGSDFGSIAVLWKEMGLLFLESLPFFSLTLVLLLVFVMFNSMKAMFGGNFMFYKFNQNII
jgi:hypothetical protein